MLVGRAVCCFFCSTNVMSKLYATCVICGARMEAHAIAFGCSRGIETVECPSTDGKQSQTDGRGEATADQDVSAGLTKNRARNA
jgi:hypothetical protein